MRCWMVANREQPVCGVSHAGPSGRPNPRGTFSVLIVFHDRRTFTTGPDAFVKKTYDAVQNLSPIYRAAQYIENADAIIIAAGAGMSVHSGLPAFRGSEGLRATLLPDGMRGGEIGSLTQAECFAARPVQAWKFSGVRSRVAAICHRTMAIGSFNNGRRRRVKAYFCTRATSMVIFRRRGSPRNESSNATARSTCCNARHRAVQPFDREPICPPTPRAVNPRASTAENWHGRTSCCSATSNGCRTERRISMIIIVNGPL